MTASKTTQKTGPHKRDPQGEGPQTPDRQPHRAQTPGGAMTEAMAQITRMQAAAMEPLNWMGPAGMEAFNATITGMSDFVGRRLHKDIETQKTLLTCRTLQEVQQVQAGAVHEAFEDYREETERLAGIASRFLAEATEPPEPPGRT